MKTLRGSRLASRHAADFPPCICQDLPDWIITIIIFGLFLLLNRVRLAFPFSARDGCTADRRLASTGGRVSKIVRSERHLSAAHPCCEETAHPFPLGSELIYCTAICAVQEHERISPLELYLISALAPAFIILLTSLLYSRSFLDLNVGWLGLLLVRFAFRPCLPGFDDPSWSDEAHNRFTVCCSDEHGHGHHQALRRQTATGSARSCHRRTSLHRSHPLLLTRTFSTQDRCRPREGSVNPPFGLSTWEICTETEDLPCVSSLGLC